jgi:hypothetical protein
VQILQNRIFIVFTLVFIFLIQGCNDSILEYENVASFKVVETNYGSSTNFEISGLCTNSSMNVDKVNYEQNNDTLNVIVFQILMRKEGAPGNFNEKININKQVNVITFGKNKKVVWKR